jgi:hypothetical protein
VLVVRRQTFTVLSLVVLSVGVTPVAAQQADAPLGPAPALPSLVPNGTGTGLAILARAEGTRDLGTASLDYYRLGTTIATPAKGGTVWLSYRASVSPFEQSMSFRGDSTRTAWRTTSMSHATQHEISLGLSRRIGQVALSISGGGARAAERVGGRRNRRQTRHDVVVVPASALHDDRHAAVLGIAHRQTSAHDRSH